MIGKNDQEKRIRQLHNENIELRQKLAICERDRDTYLDQLEGRKDLMWWAQLKVHRQRVALDDLTRRNTNLRFALRLHDQLRGHALTKEEWKAARDAMTNEQHQERIDAEPVPA